MISVFARHKRSAPRGSPNVWRYDPETGCVLARLKVDGLEERDVEVLVRPAIVPGRKVYNLPGALVVTRTSSDVWKVEDAELGRDLPRLSLWLTHAPEDVSFDLSRLGEELPDSGLESRGTAT